MTKLERALQLELEEQQLTPDRERIDVILDPERLMIVTCPSYYYLKENCNGQPCKNCWNEEV